MRPIQRLDGVPPTLGPNGSGGRKATRLETAVASNSDANRSFPDHWNKPDVRGHLYASQGHVCAYCGRELPGNDRGDVEHFRPKAKVTEAPEHGGYWWLAYSLNNYVLSCRICNSYRKRSRFPLRPRAMHMTYPSRARLSREARALWNPTLDPLDDWLRVDWSDHLIPVMPIDTLARTPKTIVAESIKLFRINADPNLVRGRIGVREAVLHAIENADMASAGRCAIRYRPHSIVARTILADLHPHALPSRRIEVAWLLDRLRERLEVVVGLLELFPDDKTNQRDFDEMQWSLSTLLMDPDEEIVAMVETFGANLGLLEDMQAQANQLRQV
ncbi:MAG: HNH endonuclease [Gammaproteobacteria bacterium]